MGRITRPVLAGLLVLALAVSIDLTATGCPKKCNNQSGHPAAGSRC